MPRLHAAGAGPKERRRALLQDEAEAAAEAGIAFVCLYACYLRGGIDRFRQSSVAEYLSQLEALRAGGIGVGVTPPSVPGTSRLRMRMLANVPRVITRSLPRRAP